MRRMRKDILHDDDEKACNLLSQNLMMLRQDNPLKIKLVQTPKVNKSPTNSNQKIRHGSPNNIMNRKKSPNNIP